MSDSHYLACKYSATVRTDDLAVLHMLRGLSQHCESGSYPQISWGGTSAVDWKRNRRQVTFRFTAPSDRTRFFREAGRLLPAGSWAQVRADDNDPASRRRL